MRTVLLLCVVLGLTVSFSSWRSEQNLVRVRRSAESEESKESKEVEGSGMEKTEKKKEDDSSEEKETSAHIKTHQDIEGSGETFRFKREIEGSGSSEEKKENEKESSEEKEIEGSGHSGDNDVLTQ